MNSAPPEIAYCPLCGASLITRMVTDKKRRACPACDYIHFTDPKVGVGVLVVEEGKVLLVRRTMNPERGKWSIPAGFLDRGENPKETAVREAWEELHLHIIPDRIIGVHATPQLNTTYANGDQIRNIGVIFHGQILGGTLAADPDEIVQVAWMAPQEALHSVHPSRRDHYKNILRHQKTGYFVT